MGEGRDIAEAIAWLCGDGGRWVTGAVIDVDGGFTLGLGGSDGPGQATGAADAARARPTAR